jgi:(5-formylfuran-3-yl)methyl phosphate transaminase
VSLCKVTEKALNVTPFIVMDIMEKAGELEKKGRHIIHLEVGEPGFPTPDCITQAAIKALNEGKTSYTHSQGLPALRREICNFYHNRYGVEITPDRVIVSSGTSPVMLLLFMALVNPGDEIILSNPHYACYPNFIRQVDGVPVKVPVSSACGYALQPQDIKKAMSDKTKAILINSPSNPTGCVLGEQELRDLAALGLPIISDEIYHGLTYEGEERSILEFTENCFVINGFSKAYAMTGWRLGYIIVPPEFARPIQKMHQNFFISANNFVQHAGIAALTEAEPDVARMREEFNRRRLLMIERLEKLGLMVSCHPRGAFYVLADARHISQDSYSLAFDILTEAGVACSPGIDFGDAAEGFLRFAYTAPLEDIAEGMDRLQNYLETKYPGK